MAYYYQQPFMGQPQQHPHHHQHFMGLQHRQYHQQSQQQYRQKWQQQQQHQMQPLQPPQSQQYDDRLHGRIHFKTYAPVQDYNSQKSPLVIKSGDLPVHGRQQSGQPPYPTRQKIAAPLFLNERRGRRSLRGVASANDLISATPITKRPVKAVAVQGARRAFEPRPPKFTSGYMPPQLERLMPPEADVVSESKYASGHPNLQLINKVDGNGNMTCGVFKVKNKKNGQLMILKRVAMGTRRSKAEVFALWQLRQATVHPNVNFIIEYFIDDRLDCYSLVLNNCDRGTLEDMMKAYESKGRKTPVALVYHIFLSLSRALSFIHFGIVDPVSSELPIIEPWNAICHLDIKLSNVFVKSNDGNGTKLPRIVLGDFGCAVSDWDVANEKENPFAQSHGTPGWFPPENFGSLTYKPPGTEICYGLPTDIWQTGGIVQVMCQAWKKPDQAIAETDSPCGEAVDPELQRAVKACMNPDFRKRPGASQIVKKLTDVMRLKGYETWH